jgi:hypothetical protein
VREGQVSVQVSTGSSPSAAANDATVTLRVEERVSGVTLVNVEFTPAEWWRLIIGAVSTRMAEVPDDYAIPLIGKQMGNDSIAVPKPVYEHIKGTHVPGVYDRARPEQLEAGEQWAREHWADIPEPKQIGTRWSNSGMTAYIRYWAAPVPCETCGKYAGDHDWSDECRPR